jgi:putative membrane protein
MMGWYQDGWGSAGVTGMLMMIVVWGGLIALAVWAVVRFTRTEHSPGSTIEPPRAILDRRFASGEITADEYAQARRILEGASPGAPTA